MNPKYGKVVNGKLELTAEGHKFLQDNLVSEVIKSFNVPGPLVGNPQFQHSMSRMNISYHTLRRDTVDKPKIPVSGMYGFSEEGTPQDWDLAIGEVYGYRWWKLLVPAKFAGYVEAPEKTLKPETARLIGANGCLWEPGVLEARCTVTHNSAPSWADLLVGLQEPFKHEPPEIREACGCGFWAYFDQFLPVTSHFSSLGAGKPYRTHGDMVEIPVFGVIKGSGRVIIGEKGFRCQYAEIVGLCLPETAVTQLGWWIREAQLGGGRELNSVRNTTFYRAAMGGSGWYDSENPYGNSSVTETTEASRDEVLTRVSFVEGLLSMVYPGAKIMSDRNALRAYFPPDKNYS